jgi:phosphoglycerate dehydrogenase-like enzyme
MKLLLPDSIELDLPADIGGIVYAVDRPIPDEHADAEALVVWGNPSWQLRDAAERLTGLRWVQTLAAGPDAALALTLAAARRLHLLVRAQIGRRWAGELGGLQPVSEPGSFRTLRDARVAVWGFGGIAATLSPLLAALGARVTGIARSAGERHGFPVVAPSDLPNLLPETDVLINILPATDDTRHAVNAEVLSLLPPHAWLVNVGRGATVDEAALVNAVRGRRLAGAALDVFETEPLPPTSPLWDEPDVIISPHAAGGRPIGATTRIADNYRAFGEGAPLTGVVHR